MPSTERVAFLDTSVLYPVSLMDLGMRLAEREIHDIRWTEDLLTELERVWDRGRSEGRRVPSPGAAAAAFDGIRRTFPDCEVPRASYEALIDQMPGSDPDDKPHSAAAVAGGATHIVTADKSGGFPPAELSTRGVIVAHPNDYYTQVAREYPDDLRAVVTDMAARRAARHPGFGVDDLLARFDNLQMPDFAAQLRQ